MAQRASHRQHSTPVSLLLILVTSGLLVSVEAFTQPAVPSTSDIADATAIVIDGFTADNLHVRAEAVRLLGYSSGDPRDRFARLQSLFGEFIPGEAAVGLPLFRYHALASLYALDPERTVAWLHRHNDAALDSLDRYELFRIIGFERIPTFDNVFYADLAGSERGPNGERFRTIALAEFALIDDAPEYAELVEWAPGAGDGSPADLLWLHEYLRERGLPTTTVRYLMEDGGGVLEGREVLHRTYTFEELLFQALLYRLGYTNAVYRRTVTTQPYGLRPSRRAVEKHGLSAGTETLIQDPQEYAVFPSLRMNAAVARIYAGAPTEQDATTVWEMLDAFPKPMLYRYVATVLRAPSTPAETELRHRLLGHDDVEIRRLIADDLAGYRFDNHQFSGTELIAAIDDEPDPLVQARLLESLASTGGTVAAPMALDTLRRYMAHPDAFIRLGAAAGILRWDEPEGEVEQ